MQRDAGVLADEATMRIGMLRGDELRRIRLPTVGGDDAKRSAVTLRVAVDVLARPGGEAPWLDGVRVRPVASLG